MGSIGQNCNDFCRYECISRSFTNKPSTRRLILVNDDLDKCLLSNPLLSAQYIEQEAINFLTKMIWKGGENE